MNEHGTLFGWAFGDSSRAHDEAYLDQLRSDALANATQDAASRGFGVEPGTESYTVVRPGETLLDDENAPDRLIVRCTVKIVGPGSAMVHAEGPMNG
jgi:hypothetical protein